MADNTPLLSQEGDITPGERVALIGLTKHPGYLVLEKMFMSACRRANDAVISLDPTEEGYERKLKALQQKARERNEFSLLVLQSIAWHELFDKKPVNEQPEQNPITRMKINDNRTTKS